MITLHKLKLFMLVYERGSFNQAAAELYMAQSAVSQHIQSLESTLGTPLFTRSARGASPTASGDVLYGYAQKMTALLADAEREIGQMSGVSAAPLRVSATPGISVYLIPNWLQRFQASRPDIAVAMQTALTHEVIRGVLSQRDDLGFLEGELDELDSPQLGRNRLWEIEYVIAVNPLHPWAQRDKIAVDELRTQAFITRQPSSRARKWLDSTLAAHDIRLRNNAELDSPGAIKYALLDHSGAAILPAYVISREAERGELHIVRIEGVALSRPLLMVWDKRREFTPIQRAFIALLAQSAPQLQVLL
jgi:DNA-binding transcriptional LysR family regulator